MPQRDGESRAINSVVAGFGLIRALERRHGLTSLKDLAAEAGMTPSRAHAYLTSFRAVGLVAQEQGGDRYRLGPYALTLGLAALARLDPADAAREPMRSFVAATGEAIHLSVWSGAAPVIVSRQDGRRPTPLTIRIGFALPLDISASGRLFLAFLPGALAALPEARTTQLRPVLDCVRAEGLASTDGLVQSGLAALSAPVFGGDGTLQAALTALGPAGLLDVNKDGKVAAALRKAAQAASEALGWRPAAKRAEQRTKPAGR
ncbi:IclR family transcriptional regulator [Falsiroseomonas oryzae]|uniref:IclR family transcriptional regulator n=1 Tax=Falsiroseomonas oryzae TaxID=2766473 RepID=UPI0022EB7A1F|nr:IclR family transcriptional regulator [Roseomonas sp. MO-31]